MSGRPTVALVAHGIHDGGGMERALYELVHRAGDRYRFVVLASELDERVQPLVDWRRIAVPMRPIPLKFLVFGLVAGLRLRRVRADLVHTLGAIVPNRADVATIQFCQAGAVVATRGLAPPVGSRLRRTNTALTRALSLAAERWCYRPRRLRRFAAVSIGVAGELEVHYPAIGSSLTPNGVDVERYRPDTAARAGLRADAGVDDGTTVALFVGGDWERKGLDVAIDGVAAAGRRMQLWVVGRGDESRFGRVASSAGVDIRFFGIRRDTERFFQAADVFVLPTFYETFSLVAYEAAASGLPVVATRVHGIDELVGDDAAGLLVERSGDAFAAALARIADDADLRARLGTEGRRRAAAYDWGRSADSVLSVYDELLERSA
jgi:UDP-glucose:(heptosyl)LPS alpha-1,3-glucosyltransferase